MDTTMDIANYIPVGYENRISRSELMHRTHMPDRYNRRAIAESDAVIINAGGGYFIPDPESEDDCRFLRIYTAQESRRAITLGRKVVRLQKAARECRL